MPSAGEDDRIVRVSLQEVVGFALRAFVPAAVVAIVAASVAFWLGRGVEPEYRSVAILLATRTAGGYPTSSVLVPPQIDPGIYRSALIEGPLLVEVLESWLGSTVDEQTLREWRRRVSVRVEDSLVSSLIRIEVESASPDRAAELANLLASSLRTWDRNRVNQNISAGIDALAQAVDRLDASIEEAELSGDEGTAALLRSYRQERLEALAATRALLDSGAAVGLLESFRRAEPREQPVNDRAVTNAAIAFVLAFVAIYVVLLARWVFSPYVRGVEDAEMATGSRVVAALMTTRGPTAAGIDASVGWLHVRLRPGESAGPGALVHLFTCARYAADKEGLSVHVAASLADAGYRVLLVDADLMTTTVTRLLDIKAGTAVPLEDMLAGSQEAGRPVSVITGAQSSYGIVPSFRRLSRGLPLLDAGMRDLLATWRADYDVILVDGAPVLPRADVHAIANLVDGIVFAVVQGRTVVDDVRGAVAALRDVTSKPLYTVLATEGRGWWRAPGRRAMARARVASGGSNQGEDGSWRARSA